MDDIAVMKFEESKTTLLSWLSEVEAVHTSGANVDDKKKSYLNICSKYELPPMVFE